MEFAEAVLTDHSRRDVAQATIKSKLRGRKLLLENAVTIAPGELRRPRRSSAAGTAAGKGKRTRLAGAGMSRAARRNVLIEAVRSVTYEQLLQQHAAWQEYAAHALRAAKDASEASQLMNQLDWHGARVRVVHSRCGSYEHAVGLVLAETKRMLLLLSETKRVWVPKVGSVVELTLPAACPCGQPSVQCEAEKHH